MFSARQVLFTSNWREVMGLLIEREVSVLPYWNIELTALCSYCSYYSRCFGLFSSVRRQTAYWRNDCAFYTPFPLLLQIQTCQSPVIFTSRLPFAFCSRLHVCVSYNSHNKFCLSSYTAFTGWDSDVTVLQHSSDSSTVWMQLLLFWASHIRGWDAQKLNVYV